MVLVNGLVSMSGLVSCASSVGDEPDEYDATLDISPRSTSMGTSLTASSACVPNVMLRPFLTSSRLWRRVGRSSVCLVTL